MHILVAVDRSAESQNALENALDNAAQFDATVTVVHAVDSEGDAGDPEQRGEELLEEVIADAPAEGVAIETRVLVGDPVEAVPAYAEEIDADVIYVGHRGLSAEDRDPTGEERGPLGGVASGILEETTIPVTVFDRTS